MHLLNKTVSRRKGEAIVNFETGNHDAVKVVFHANTLTPIRNSLHFGLKPGHLMIHVRRRGRESGEWLLQDRGYTNYFRPESAIESDDYNTLRSQKLLTKGWLLEFTRLGRLTFLSFTILPFHIRTITIASNALTVDDYYLWRRRVVWNLVTGTELPRRWFHQHRRFEL